MRKTKALGGQSGRSPRVAFRRRKPDRLVLGIAILGGVSIGIASAWALIGGEVYLGLVCMLLSVMLLVVAVRRAPWGR